MFENFYPKHNDFYATKKLLHFLIRIKVLEHSFSRGNFFFFFLFKLTSTAESSMPSIWGNWIRNWIFTFGYAHTYFSLTWLTAVQSTVFPRNHNEMLDYEISTKENLIFMVFSFPFISYPIVSGCLSIPTFNAMLYNSLLFLLQLSIQLSIKS